MNLFYFNNIFFFSPLTATTELAARLARSTTLTNKKAGPPGKYFTRKQKDDLLFGIYQEGLLAQEALGRLDDMSEMDRAEAELSEAQAAYAGATDPKSVVDANTRVREATSRLDGLRAAEARRRTIDEAKDRIKKQVADAIAKRRDH